MYELRVKNTIKFPTLLIQGDLKVIADTIIIPVIQENINNGVALDERPFPELEPSTVEKKYKNLVGARENIAKTLARDKTVHIAGYGRTLVEHGKSQEEIRSFTDGMSFKTLIDTGKLISSFVSRLSGKNKVIVTIQGDRKKVGEFLQIKGVGKKRKKFNFFGISTRMEQDAMNYMKRRINEAIANVR
jgi:hypothetical protein